jgi:hypothetical protein
VVAINPRDAETFQQGAGGVMAFVAQIARLGQGAGKGCGGAVVGKPSRQGFGPRRHPALLTGHRGFATIARRNALGWGCDGKQIHLPESMSPLQKGKFSREDAKDAEKFRREIRFYQRLSAAKKAFCSGVIH